MSNRAKSEWYGIATIDGRHGGDLFVVEADSEEDLVEFMETHGKDCGWKLLAAAPRAMSGYSSEYLKVAEILPLNGVAGLRRSKEYWSV